MTFIKTTDPKIQWRSKGTAHPWALARVILGCARAITTTVAYLSKFSNVSQNLGCPPHGVPLDQPCSATAQINNIYVENSPVQDTPFPV